jgi:hypothetical protein
VVSKTIGGIRGIGVAVTSMRTCDMPGMDPGMKRIAISAGRRFGKVDSSVVGSRATSEET